MTWFRRDEWYCGMGSWCVDYVYMSEDGWIVRIPCEYTNEIERVRQTVANSELKPHATKRPDYSPSTTMDKSYLVEIEL